MVYVPDGVATWCMCQTALQHIVCAKQRCNMVYVPDIVATWCMCQTALQHGVCAKQRCNMVYVPNSVAAWCTSMCLKKMFLLEENKH
jgi:hypothetical protein